MKPILSESNLQTAYHFTTINGIAEMLSSGSIDLSMSYGKAKEKRFDMGKYPFFLSTTQYKNPNMGYPTLFPSPVARLEMNMPYLTSQGRFKRVMFFNKKEQENETGNPNFFYQSEDRLLSNKSHLPFSKSVIGVTFFGKGRNYKIPKSIVEQLHKFGIPYEFSDTEPDFEANSDEATDRLTPEESAMIVAIGNIWGDSSSLEAKRRAESYLGRTIALTDTSAIRNIKAKDVSSAIGKAIMMPYIKNYMADGRSLVNLIDDLSGALKK